MWEQIYENITLCLVAFGLREITAQALKSRGIAAQAFSAFGLREITARSFKSRDIAWSSWSFCKWDYYLSLDEIFV